MNLIECYTTLGKKINTSRAIARKIEEAFAEYQTPESRLLFQQLDEALIQSDQYREAVYELATLDGLTGLRNRAHYNEMLHDLNDASDLACLLMDIDHFKKYNDTFGHRQGDSALRSVAGIVKQFGDSHLVFRYGGEEYLLLFLNKSYTPESLFCYADRLRKSVEEVSIPLVPNFLPKNPSLYPRGVHQVTISVGGAIRTVDESLESLVERADRALYEAKKTRNAVKISEV